MGLSCASVEMIIQEHLYRPITGKVLLIGRQNTDITPEAMTNLLQLYGLSPRVPLVLETRGSLEHKTVALSDETPRIADVSVFHSLSDCQVLALDISDYEGAEIIHDMNLPLPDKYKGQFDFIFDGSSLDNIFNVTQALFNLSELLRPGGRMLLYNASNSAPTAYLQFSPDWIFDYFAVNRYVDCKVYVHEFAFEGESIDPNPLPPGGYPPQNGCFWHFDPLVIYSGQYGFQNSHITDGGYRFFHSIAEKGFDSTSTKAPVQMHYRGNETAVYLEAAKRFRASLRPIVYPRSGEPFDVPSISFFKVVYPLTRWTKRQYPPQEYSSNENLSPAIGAKPIVRTEPESADEMIERLTAERDKALRLAKQFETEKDARVLERDQYLTERDQARLSLTKRMFRKVRATILPKRAASGHTSKSQRSACN
jgi:hypothetical protein